MKASRGNECTNRAVSIGRLRSVVPLWFAIFTIAALATGCSARPVNGDLLRGRSPTSATHAHRAERITDGVRAVAGDLWNSDLTSVIGAGGGVEWDLGSPRKIAAAWIQADDNDIYAVLASNDGRSWKTIWEAPSVAQPQLQVRYTRELDETVRYVRLEPRAGDGNYAVAEFALFDTAQAEIPPRFAERKGRPEADAELSEEAVALAIAGPLALVALWMAMRRAAPGEPRGTWQWLREPLVWTLLLSSALLAVTACRYRASYRYNTIDDAYISFQYAKNWIAGNGVVFNIGERVEGYTNFLWVAVLAPLWPLVGRDPVRFAEAAFLTTLALAFFGLIGVAIVARRVLTHRLSWTIAVLLVAFDDSYVSYAVFSLENHLLVVCMLAGLIASVYRFRRWELVLGVSLALVAMTRPDGVLWAASFFVTEALSAARAAKADRKALLGALARAAGTFVGCYGSYFAWRFAYYGYLFPNTFYLKVGDTFAGVQRGLDYVKAYVVERWAAPIAALTGLLRLREQWVQWLVLHALLHTAYVVYVGGDFYSGQRFLIALIPSLALLTAAGADWVQSRWSSLAPRVAVAGVALTLCLLLRWGTITSGPGVAEIRVWGDNVDTQVRLMRWMKGVARPEGSMVLGDIGGAGFFADLRVADVYGVIDPVVAHRKVAGFGTGKAGHEKVATASELLARNPTYIKLGFLPVSTVPPGYYLFNDLPPSVHYEGIFVRDDLEQGETLSTDALRLDRNALARWHKEGDAFDDALTGGNARNRPVVQFASGTLIDTFAARHGDEATGRLVSPPFTLRGDRLRLLVGGGRDPVRLRVSLVVDGATLFSETGTGFESLGRREWNIAPLRGKVATIEIVDDAKGNWGHLLVDEIYEWVGTPNDTGKL